MPGSEILTQVIDNLSPDKRGDYNQHYDENRKKNQCYKKVITINTMNSDYVNE